MNKILLTVIILLVTGTVITMVLEPRQQTTYPLLYWKSDMNPQRYEQLELFGRWLKKHHPELFGKDGQPPFMIKLDSANNQSTLIQAVSGVGGDLLDTVIPGYYAMGLIEEIGSDSSRRGYGLDSTYPDAASLICTYDERQAGYPCNLNVCGFWINLDTLQKYGIEVPREEWTLDEFEQIAREFTRKANQGQKHRTSFFAPSAEGMGPRFCLINSRSHGEDIFNETLTRSTLDQAPHYRMAMEKLYKWTYVDGILPTAAELASSNVESGGYGGVAFTRFINGQYASLITARYSLIRFRNMPSDMRIRMTNVQYPMSGKYRNMLIAARSTALYAGSRNKEYAKYFFEFLASREYNEYIIRKTDGLPPTPKYLQNNPEFLKPAEYPNEGNVHANELKWATTIACTYPVSPYFVSPNERWERYALDKYMNNRASAAGVLKEVAARINADIAQAVRDNPKLAARYGRDAALQKKIDEYKNSGRKIPVNWIRNPFYKKYYQSLNMLGQPESGQ